MNVRRRFGYDLARATFESEPHHEYNTIDSARREYDERQKLIEKAGRLGWVGS